MHDKTVRRRRAVLALLVLLSLILISASFGSSGSGPLHGVQSGFLDVVSPIEAGASKVLTPVHDLFNWIDDVFDASSQRNKYRSEYSALLGKYARLETRERENADAAKLLGLDRRDRLSADGPVSASIVVRGESLFVQQLTIDAGSASGVAVDDPVICADGLVGVVTSVASGAATVNLINDSSARAAVVDNRNDELGIVQADPGDPTLLQMIDVPDVTTLHVGDLIVTAGSAVTHNGTLFPPNVPVGIVKSLPAAGDDTGTVTVTPSVNFGAIGAIQVLTRVPR